jgi:DNA repair protein RecN (Recombination protein N)
LCLDEDTLILRRVIDRQGKSRAFVNGTPCTVGLLRRLGECLLDVHAQHEHHSLLKPVAQRQWLDEFGRHQGLLKTVADTYESHRQALQALVKAQTEASQVLRERQALELECEELGNLAPQPGEWQMLSAKQARQANAEAIVSAAEGTRARLGDSILSELGHCIHELEKVAKHDEQVQSLLALLNESSISLGEAEQGLNRYLADLETNDDDAADTESRLSALFQLARRYRWPAEDLPALWESKKSALSALALSADVAHWQRAEAECAASLKLACAELSKARQIAAKNLTQAVNLGIKELAMGNACFNIALLPSETSSTGAETVEFQLASHQSLAMQSVAKAASGGELARLGLALMVAMGSVSETPTLVFDEIDVGIGGAVADVVGQKLAQLACHHQIICVTHQAQVAAHANHHYSVRKILSAEQVRTQVVDLDESNKTEELARMLSGSEITDTTRALATELRAEAQAKIAG